MRGADQLVHIVNATLFEKNGQFIERAGKGQGIHIIDRSKGDGAGARSTTDARN